VLEIGTSSGYSTIWLANALQHSQVEGTRLTSIDRSSEKLAMARCNLERAGLLSSSIELIAGEATEIVRSLAGPFDCVFFDADRLTAPEQLQLLLPKLTPEVLLLADNALSHPDEIAGYKRMVEQLPDFACTLVPIGKGLHIAWRGGR
jgi:predicted O-methyltransferase YrrM